MQKSNNLLKEHSLSSIRIWLEPKSTQNTNWQIKGYSPLLYIILAIHWHEICKTRHLYMDWEWSDMPNNNHSNIFWYYLRIWTLINPITKTSTFPVYQMLYTLFWQFNWNAHSHCHIIINYNNNFISSQINIFIFFLSKKQTWHMLWSQIENQVTTDSYIKQINLKKI